MTTKFMLRILRSRVYFSPIYGFPGVNVIEDKTSPAYDPFGSSLSTLVKVNSDVLLEDSGAWLSITKMLKSRRSVKQLLERQKLNVKITSSRRVDRKTSGPRIKSDRSGAIKK
jgi:hypothetical protein